MRRTSCPVVERCAEYKEKNKDFASELLDKVVRFQLDTGLALASAGVDIIWMGDDFGTQDSLILSPETWRYYFKPRYAQLIAAFKKKRPDYRLSICRGR